MRNVLPSLLSRERIAGGALILALLQVLSSIVGFFRDQAFSIMFPLDTDPVGVASVYIAAFRPSDLLFQITVMSSLSVVLVPFLAGHLAHGRKEEIDRLLSSTMLVFGVLFGIAALILAIIFPTIAPSLTQFTGESLDLYIRFGRIALLTNFLFVFGNALGQYLIAVQRYWIYGITPIVWGLSTVAGTYLFTSSMGAMGPIIGTLLGTILYLFIRSIAVFRHGCRFRLPKSILHTDLREMGWLILPRMVALGALQLQLLVLDNFASGLGSSAVAVNQFARNFESLIPGIIGISLAQAAFSPLSQSAATKDRGKFFGQLSRGILYNIGLSLPGALALGLLAGVGAWLIRLGPETTPIFITALWIYAAAVPLESINHLMLRSFYALKNTTLPAVGTALGCGAAIACGSFLLPMYGVYAIVLAFVASQLVQTVFLSLTLQGTLRRSMGLTGSGVQTGPSSA